MAATPRSRAPRSRPICTDAPVDECGPRICSPCSVVAAILGGHARDFLHSGGDPNNLADRRC